MSFLLLIFLLIFLVVAYSRNIANTEVFVSFINTLQFEGRFKLYKNSLKKKFVVSFQTIKHTNFSSC